MRLINFLLNSRMRGFLIQRIDFYQYKINAKESD
ncbi:hypothetical protein DN756_16305 [Yersinia pseudotuberculosis]|nr:hypothetical protein EGX87_19175 [Yersinia pseudotuberculosis]AYW99876.1 hypothetical protein EGX53_08320 [Yersinia pseudotuberculosis]AZA31439.1 hypothetical protein DN756_16305 [Yersinia pseudotuberculosis]PSH16639.1 hypothetical protein B7R75_04130 [Yersinia pseudotuberculosis]PSH36556.1 hypothetical protein BA192_12185 [Yersinia pseudotuberculosis]